ncbi:MAG TPA: DNA mismatch repair endonuclease MutL [Clostridiales bacterium]|nr:DNA mismatch repair endonuclease MutL [Clostridiales bacterium]
MNRIHVLDQQTANSIAAGEVVERPASVVKELIENALDAGASVVSVEIRQGGVSLIRIADNGSGMSRDDALLAFARHATSKITSIEDLDSIATMGFRGEALASIGAVAKVRLETRQLSDADGTWLQVNGGTMSDSGTFGGPAGTTITVENLFYNVPARFKFLRKDTTEAGVVADVVERLALARPDVSFRLVSNQQEILHTPGNNDLTSTVYAVYGKQVATACLSIEGSQSPLKLSGLAGRPELARNSRAQQCFYVNGRLVRAKAMTAALDEAYQTLLMKGKYAFAVLFLELPPQLVDVNVHPQKMEVRFWNDQEVFRMIYHTIKSALLNAAGVSGESADQAEQPAPVPTAEERHEPVAMPSADYGLPSGEPAALPQQPALRIGEPVQLYQPSEQDLPKPPQILKINDLSRARLIGQLFNTYILMELDQELLLIDQHAAHEKIIFENLVARRQGSLSRPDEVPLQPLLVPLVIEFSRQEMQLLQHEASQIQQLGFEYDLFGPASVALRSYPDTGRHQLQAEAAFRLAVETMLAEPLNSEDKIADFYYSMACKAAVKAHDVLKPAEIEQLLSDLQLLENPYQCPHGRPVIVRMPRHELEKRFKRIV